MTREVTYTATWTAKKYKIEFEANGHGTAPAAIEQDYETAVTEPEAPEEA